MSKSKWMHERIIPQGIYWHQINRIYAIITIKVYVSTVALLCTPGLIPFLFLHAKIPRSTSSRVIPSLTKQNVTPNSVSTLRLRASSSKNSISSYAIELAPWIRAKCCVLVLGKTCT